MRYRRFVAFGDDRRTHRPSRLGSALVALLVALLAMWASERRSSACSENVYDHLGISINSTPVTSLFYWPPVRADASSITSTMTSVTNNASFYTRVSEYGVPTGQAGTVIPAWLNPYPTGGLDESTIQEGLYLDLLYDPNGIHYPATGEVFVVFLPNGTYSKLDCSGCNGFNCNPSCTDCQGNACYQGAHHWYASYQFPDGNTYNIIYAVVEYNANSVGVAVYNASHELYESFTDPIWTLNNGSFLGGGYYDDTNDGYTSGNERELADMCQVHLGGTPYWLLNGVALAQLWSQNACSCR